MPLTSAFELGRSNAALGVTWYRSGALDFTLYATAASKQAQATCQRTRGPVGERRESSHPRVCLADVWPHAAPGSGDGMARVRAREHECSEAGRGAGGARAGRGGVERSAARREAGQGGGGVRLGGTH